MSQAEALARRFYALVDSRDVDGLDEVVDPAVVVHGVEARGIAELKGRIAEMFAAFPDLSVTIEDLVAEGDKAAVRVTSRGTHSGEYEGAPPTGRFLEIPEIGFVKVAGGRIVEVWQSYDRLDAMIQMGLMGEAEEATI